MAIAPNLRFLFMSVRHREALVHLRYGVTGNDHASAGTSGGFVLLGDHAGLRAGQEVQRTGRVMAMALNEGLFDLGPLAHVVAAQQSVQAAADVLPDELALRLTEGDQLASTDRQRERPQVGGAHHEGLGGLGHRAV